MKLERDTMAQLVLQKYELSESSDLLCINQARKVLWETCCEWDRDFCTLARKYLLASNRRSLISTQIRRVMEIKDENRLDGSVRRLMFRVTAGDESPMLLVTTTSLEKWTTCGNERCVVIDD